MDAADRESIENKYHKKNEPFNPFQRMAYHGYDFDASTGLSDAEIQNGLSELHEKIVNLPHPIAKARAVRYVLKNTRIDISEHDWFVGIYSLNRLANAVTVNQWNSEAFDTIIPTIKKKMETMCSSSSATIWPDFDHVVPDWDAVLSLGFSGLLKRSEAYREIHRKNDSLSADKDAFFEGIAISYQSILDLIERMYRYALTKTHRKAPLIAQCLCHLKDGAPQTFYEALQTIYLYFIVSECFDSYQVRSLGNGLDNSLYRFYRHDLESGAFTKKELREFLSYFLMQWSAIGNYWGQPFYLGGTDADGKTRYNDLSGEILAVYDELGIYNPKIQLKINFSTPEWLLHQALEMVRRGHNSMVFCCEPGMIDAVMRYGATLEEAQNMDIRGCYETGIRGKEVSTITAYINAPKAVEYALYNGYDRTIFRQNGLMTGETSDLPVFEDFYRAVIRQWDHLIDTAIEVSRAYDPYLGVINPSNLYSATIEDSLKCGTDAYQSGVQFNNSALLNCGFACLVDCVMAVKEFVYDKKEITAEKLKEALDQNWNGYEALRRKILKSSHKYGNGDFETDRYAAALATHFVSKVANRPNGRGGVYKAFMHSARQFIEQGTNTKATPDGRYDGAEISKNASPSVGMDKNGVTALIHSALSLNPSSYSEGFCLDVMLHPSAVQGEDGLSTMKALLMAYMKNGGMSMQFNVFSTDTLRDAQKHPEQYRNLQVRVCGWNVLWNNLSADEQNAYIRRANSIQR